jgi:hypothetical protein
MIELRQDLNSFSLFSTWGCVMRSRSRLTRSLWLLFLRSNGLLFNFIIFLVFCRFFLSFYFCILFIISCFGFSVSLISFLCFRVSAWFNRRFSDRCCRFILLLTFVILIWFKGFFFKPFSNNFIKFWNSFYCKFCYFIKKRSGFVLVLFITH